MHCISISVQTGTKRLSVHFSTLSFIIARAINPQNNYLGIDNKLRPTDRERERGRERKPRYILFLVLLFLYRFTRAPLFDHTVFHIFFSVPFDKITGRNVIIICKKIERARPPKTLFIHFI